MSDLFATEADRGWAESTLLDSCTITRDDAESVTWDDDLGMSVYGDDTLVYTGSCSVSMAISDRRVIEGADPRVLGEWVVRIPVAVTDVVSGDTVKVDSVKAGGDPGLVDRVFTVRRVGARSSAILRRLWCEVRESTTR